MPRPQSVSPRLADGCFSPAMQEPSHSRPTPSAALSLLYGVGRPLHPERSSRLGRPRHRVARNPITLRSRCGDRFDARLAAECSLLWRPAATPAAGGASRDGVALLTPALLLPQERGRQAPADRGFRSGRAGELPRAVGGLPLVTLAEVSLDAAPGPAVSPRRVRSVHPDVARTAGPAASPQDETEEAPSRLPEIGNAEESDADAREPPARVRWPSVGAPGKRDGDARGKSIPCRGALVAWG